MTFGEFIVASVSKKDVLEQKRMTACFKSFDVDGSGAISLAEIKDIIGKMVRLPEHVWRRLMATDEDGNNEMDSDEFAMMLKNVFDG